MESRTRDKIILLLQWSAKFSSEIHDGKGKRDDMGDIHTRIYIYMDIYIYVFLGSK